MSRWLRRYNPFFPFGYQDSHHGDRPPTRREIETLLAAMELRIMSGLSDGIAQLKADDEELEADVEELIGVVDGIPSVVASAVQNALTAAGVDSAAAATALAEIDAAVKAETAKVKAHLPPPTPPAPAAITIDTTGITVTTGQAVSQQVTASGGTGPLSFTPTTSSDGGLSIDASGLITGTVAADGSSTLSVTVSDGGTPAADSLNATISISSAT